MASALYDKGREGFLDGSIDWDTDEIRLTINDHGVDTPVPATDDNYDDISTGTVAESAAFGTKTVTNGVADAADVTLSSVSGASCESINIRKYNATPSASRLIAYIDNATGLPVTPNGGDITIAWDSGASKIFKL